MDNVQLTASQVQLRQTRQEFRALIGQLRSNDSFPRSMTMKLLLGAGGQRAVTKLLGGSFSPVSRVTGVLRSIATSALMKLLWSTVFKK